MRGNGILIVIAVIAVVGIGAVVAVQVHRSLPVTAGETNERTPSATENNSATDNEVNEIGTKTETRKPQPVATPPVETDVPMDEVEARGEAEVDLSVQ